jgi:hypothetical protein
MATRKRKSAHVEGEIESGGENGPLGNYELVDVLRLTESVEAFIDAYNTYVLDWYIIAETLNLSPSECQALWRYIVYHYAEKGFSPASLDTGRVDESSSDVEDSLTFHGKGIHLSHKRVTPKLTSKKQSTTQTKRKSKASVDTEKMSTYGNEESEEEEEEEDSESETPKVKKKGKKNKDKGGSAPTPTKGKRGRKRKVKGDATPTTGKKTLPSTFQQETLSSTPSSPSYVPGMTPSSASSTQPMPFGQMPAGLTAGMPGMMPPGYMYSSSEYEHHHATLVPHHYQQQQQQLQSHQMQQQPQGSSMMGPPPAPSAGGAGPPAPTRKRMMWSQAEDQLLAEGVRKHGEGTWAAIRRDQPEDSILLRRTSTQLAQRWAAIKRKVQKGNLTGLDELTKNIALSLLAPNAQQPPATHQN